MLWGMVLVTVTDDNPLYQLHKRVIVLVEIEENWATLTPEVMDCVLHHFHNFNQQQYH